MAASLMAAKLVLEWMWQTGDEKDGEMPWQAKQDVRVHEPRRRREGGRESGGVHEYDSNLISLDVWWRGVWGGAAMRAVNHQRLINQSN